MARSRIWILAIICFGALFRSFLPWPPPTESSGCCRGKILNPPCPFPKNRTISLSFNRPHTIKGLVILAVVIGLFFSPLPKEVIALAAAGIHLASTKFRTDDLLGLVEWPILVLFMGLFVVTGAFQATGCGDQAVQWLAHGGFNLNAPATLALTTAGLSNLINNSAAVMLLLKVINLSQPATAYILALANSFGGSLIIIGSVPTSLWSNRRARWASIFPSGTLPDWAFP